MPAKAEKRGDVYRVVEAGSGVLVRNDAGTPVDGRGHRTRDAAQAQARAINASKRGKK